MRALLSNGPGGPDLLAIGELPEPVALAGQVIVAVEACAINFPDLLIIDDRYQLKPVRPFAPGGEVAGTIAEVGPGVTGWKPGDRVIGFTGHGGLAELVAIDAGNVYSLPSHRHFRDGTALLFTYGTAFHALQDRGRIRAGQELLVMGAAGGVGLAAVELGKALGARVTAGVSSEEKGRAARHAGADRIVVYPRGALDETASRTLSTQFKQATQGKGFDLIFDTVGGDYAEPALRAAAWGARYLVIGFPAGIPRIPLNLPLLKGCDICGVFWGAFAERERTACAEEVAQLFTLWDEGRIAPEAAHVFPLEAGSTAISLLSRRDHLGKIVVILGD